MNKTDFINKMSNSLNYTEDKCILINDILENKFLLSKKNKDEILIELENKLNVSPEESIKIYNTATNILKEQIKYKLIHPFGNHDKEG